MYITSGNNSEIEGAVSVEDEPFQGHDEDSVVVSGLGSDVRSEAQLVHLTSGICTGSNDRRISPSISHDTNNTELLQLFHLECMSCLSCSV